jgi:hypothetical protein
LPKVVKNGPKIVIITSTPGCFFSPGIAVASAFVGAGLSDPETQTKNLEDWLDDFLSD